MYDLGETLKQLYGEHVGEKRVQPLQLPSGGVWLKGQSDNEENERRKAELLDRLGFRR